MRYLGLDLGTTTLGVSISMKLKQLLVPLQLLLLKKNNMILYYLK